MPSVRLASDRIGAVILWTCSTNDSAPDLFRNLEGRENNGFKKWELPSIAGLLISNIN